MLEAVTVALSIAGFDPSSGAGLTADLAVFAAHGIFGTGCMTAATVQSTRGVKAVHALPASLMRASLTELCEDMPPAGVKIGMLASAELVREVASFLERLLARQPVTIVLDPVLRSSSGHPLLTPDAVDIMRSALLPLVDWLTPNVAELEALVERDLLGREEIETAAQELQHTFQARSVVVTGGDQQQPDDLLVPAQGRSEWLVGERILTQATHGTGCAFSSALLARLLQDCAPLQAASEAKRYVEEAMRRAPGLGSGKGPMDLLWPLKVAQERS